MLNQIRDIIRQKESFIEAANIIMEDTMRIDLEDLYEEAAAFDPNLPELDDLQNNTGGDSDLHDDTIELSPEDVDADIIMTMESGLDEPEDDVDIMDTPIEADEDNSDDEQPEDNEGEDEPEADHIESDETPDSTTDDPSDSTDGENDGVGTDDGNFTEIEKELEDELESILSTSIDLPTNTMTDVPPVPPINAGDATVSDTFETDLMAEGAEPGNTSNSDDLFEEAITVDATGDEAAESTNEGEEKPNEGDEQNEVTDAVINKVNAAEVEGESDPDDVGKKVLDRLDKVNAEILRAKDAIKKQLGW